MRWADCRSRSSSPPRAPRCSDRKSSCGGSTRAGPAGYSSQDAEPRHRTLRATIDWSTGCSTTTPRQRSVRCGLRGGRDAPAAETVAQVTLETLESSSPRTSSCGVSHETVSRASPCSKCREYATSGSPHAPMPTLSTGVIASTSSRWPRMARMSSGGPGRSSGPVFDEESHNFQVAVDWSSRRANHGSGCSSRVPQWSSGGNVEAPRGRRLDPGDARCQPGDRRPPAGPRAHKPRTRH